MLNMASLVALQRIRLHSLHRMSSFWEKSEENTFIIYMLTSKLQYNRAVELILCSYWQKNTTGKFNLVDTVCSLTLLLGSSFILSCNNWLETFAAIGSYSLPFFWVMLVLTFTFLFIRSVHAVIGEDCWKDAQMTLSCGRNKYQIQQRHWLYHPSMFEDRCWMY